MDDVTQPVEIHRPRFQLCGVDIALVVAAAPGQVAGVAVLNFGVIDAVVLILCPDIQADVAVLRGTARLLFCLGRTGQMDFLAQNDLQDQLHDFLILHSFSEEETVQKRQAAQIFLCVCQVVFSFHYRAGGRICKDGVQRKYMQIQRERNGQLLCVQLVMGYSWQRCHMNSGGTAGVE